MDKIATPVVLVIGAFLYFTHDAGFNFERASPEKRVAFAERQAQAAVKGAQLVAWSGPGSLTVSGDALRAHIKVRSEGGNVSSRRRSDTFQRACHGYVESYLDEHSIVLRVEFYGDDNGPMEGVMTLSPTVCARSVAMAR